MNVLRHLRLSFFAVFTLFVIVALSSCSKKDVMADEPAVSPSGAGGTATSPAAPGGEAVGTSGAGEAGTSDLKMVQFPYDSFSLNNEARDILKSNAGWLKQNSTATIQVEGHCDERGTTEYNLALGERRANSARDYLVRLGIDKSRISVISYGEERPIDPGHDESAWSKNRRAAFVLLSK